MAIQTSLADKAFDPDTIDVLNKAFQGVCIELGVRDSARHSRETIAKKVLELSDSQRDPGAIRKAVVEALAAPR
jgi:hypothetical protein